MDIILKEKPRLNLRELLAFCTCDCSCIRFSLGQENQTHDEPKFTIYMTFYSCLGEKPPKYCKTEFEITLGNMETLLNLIEHGWQCKEVRYNPTASPRWMTAMVWRVDETHALTIGFYPKKVGCDEAYEKNKCAGEIILEEPEYKEFVARMQSMVDLGKELQEKWRKEHAVSSNNKK